MVSPSESFVVKKMLHSIRRHKQLDKRQPFTISNIRNILKSLSVIVSDGFTRIIMQAMFLVAFFGLFRVGELAHSLTGSQNVIRREDLVFKYKQSTVSSMSITIRNYKHSQGNISLVPLARQSNKKLCPVHALLKYLRIAPNGNGQLFRDRNGQPISTAFFRSILRSCVIANNMDPNLYTAHSFRIGGATHAYESNMPASQIQKLGRWKSTAYLKYIRSTTRPIPNN